jgi:hypothetical protein
MRGGPLIALCLLQAAHAVDHSMKLQQTLGSATVVRMPAVSFSPPLWITRHDGYIAVC